MNSRNEEIQLNFIGSITDNHRRFYILLSIDRYCKWPAASFCKYTDGETAVKFFEQYIQLNGIPKTIRTDKATAFTGRLFRYFCKKHYIKLIYGTPHVHTPTGLVERGVRTLKKPFNEHQGRLTVRKSPRLILRRHDKNSPHETKGISIRTTLRS